MLASSDGNVAVVGKARKKLRDVGMPEEENWAWVPDGKKAYK